MEYSDVINVVLLPILVITASDPVPAAIKLSLSHDTS